MKNTMIRAHQIKEMAATKWSCKKSEIVFGICLSMAHQGLTIEKEIEMKKVTWKTTTGLGVTVTIKSYLDITAEIEGMGIVGIGIKRNHDKSSNLAASIGKLGITKANIDAVEAAIAIVDAPRQAKIAKNRSDARKDTATKIANGYCFKCGSYCHGDCTSN